MSRLRQHIKGAASEYAAVRYPNDLVAQILPSRSRKFSSRISAVVGVALAAAVALVIAYRPAVVSDKATPAPVAAVVAPKAVQAQIAYASLPSRFPFILPANPLLPASPPVLVSVSSLSPSLSMLQGSYQQFGPRLLESTNLTGHTEPVKPVLPEKGTEGSAVPSKRASA